MGIPGSLVACLVVDWTRKSVRSHGNDESNGGDEEKVSKAPGVARRWSIWSGLTVLGGRKLTMAVSTLLTGVFLFLFTTSRNAADVLGYSCASGLTQYVPSFSGS